MICITWECNGESGCTVCPASDYQSVIDRLTRLGHTIVSISSLP